MQSNPIPILVITPTNGFGELIQQTLEETNRFRVILIDRAEEALHLARALPFSICILDSAIKDRLILELVTALQNLLPDVRLVLIPPDNNLSHPIMAQLSPHGYLTKPFYLPDLLDTVEEVLHQHSTHSPSQQTPESETSTQTMGSPGAKLPSPLAWLEDVSRAAQHLTRLSLESAAQAALILRAGKLWAYAGQLAQPAAEELATAVANHWVHNSSTTSRSSADMVRVVRLDVTDREYMLYATDLGTEMVLALAFDVETPFSKIRSQASQLVRALASPPTPTAQQPLPPYTPSGIPGEPPSGTPRKPPIIEPLLQDIPSPTPIRDQTDQKSPASTPHLTGTGVNKDQNLRILPDPDQQEVSLVTTSEPEQDENQKAGTSYKNSPRQDPFDEREVDVPAENNPMATREHGIKEELRPISPALHSLYYACVLLPRLPQHHLTGDLAAHLSAWLNQLCLAYGWRLEQQSIHPDYLQWIVNVSPDTSPKNVIRVLRRLLSRRIFTEFPSRAQENPSGDFWAPGYLLMSGSRPPPDYLIKKFIQNTRNYQGASNPVDRPA